MEFPFRIGHSRIRGLLSAYVDGEVSAADARRVEEHAAACSACRDELDSLTATVELVRGLPELELPRSFELTRLPEEEPRASFGVWAPRLATSVAGLLLVVLLAGDVTGALTQSGGSDEAATGSAGRRAVGTCGHGRRGARCGRRTGGSSPAPGIANSGWPTQRPRPQRQWSPAQAAPAAAAQSRSTDEEAATPEPPSAPAAAAKAGPAGMPAPESTTPAAADAPRPSHEGQRPGSRSAVARARGCALWSRPKRRTKRRPRRRRYRRGTPASATTPMAESASRSWSSRSWRRSASWRWVRPRSGAHAGGADASSRRDRPSA